MTASFPLNRKHYPKLMLDTSLIIKALSLEDVKVPVTVYIEGNIAAGKTEFLKIQKLLPFNMAVETYARSEKRV